MPEAASPGLTFANIVDIFEQVKQHDPSYAKMTLPEFSQWAQKETGENFSMGLRDSKLKRLSAGIDRVLAPVSEPLTKSGTWLTSLVTDNPNYQRMGGEILGGVPRGLVNLAGAIPAAVAATGAVAAGAPLAIGGAVGAAGLGLSALLSGADVYEKTDNIPASLIGAGSAALLPASSYVGQKAAVSALQKFMGPSAVKVGSQTLTLLDPSKGPGFVTQRAVEAGGEALAQTVNQEVAMQLTDAVMGQKTPLDEHLFQLFGSQLPFAPMIAHHALVGPKNVGGKAVDFQSLTSANTAMKLSEVHAASDAYHAAEVMKRFEDTNKRAEWRPVLSTPEEPVPTRATFLEADTPNGKVRISEPAYRYYSSLSHALSKGEKVSAQELYKQYQIPPQVSAEIMQLMQKRGVISTPDVNGEAKVTADVTPSNTAVVTEALASNPDIKLPKPKAMGEQENALRGELETLQQEGKGETPEADALRQRIKQTVSQESEDPSIVIERKLLQGEFKDDPAIRKALDVFRKQLAPKDVDSLETIVSKLAKGEVLTMPETQQISGMSGTERAAMGERVKEAKTPPDLLSSVDELTPDSKGQPAELSKGERTAAIYKKAKGPESEQVVAQAEAVIGEQGADVLKRPLVEQTPDEIMVRAQDMARQLRVMLEKAVTGPSHTLETLSDVKSAETELQLTRYINSLLKSGRYVHPSEVASRAYNMVMRRVAKQTKAAWWARQEGLEKQTFDRPSIRANLERLNELPDAVLHEMVLASNKMSNIPGYPVDLLHWFYSEGVRQWDELGAPKQFKYQTDENGKVVRIENIPQLDSEGAEWMAKFKEKFSSKSTKFFTDRYEAASQREVKAKSFGELGEVVSRSKEYEGGDDEVVHKLGLDTIQEEDLSPEQLMIQNAIETELQEAPTSMKLEDWRLVGEKMGMQRFQAKMVKPLNMLTEALRDGHFIFEDFRGDLRLRFVNSEALSVHDVAQTLGMTSQQFDKFLNDHAYRYIRGYIEKYLPQTYEQVTKRKAAFERRQATALSEAEKRAAQKQLELEQGAESKGRPIEADVDELAKLEDKTGGAVGPDLLRAPTPELFAPQIGAQLWFEKYFRNRGISGSELDSLRDMSVRIASFAKDVSYVRVGEMVSSDVSGTFFPSWKRWNGLIGLVPTSFENIEFDKFHKALVSGHELFHAQDWNATQGQNAVNKAIFENMGIIARKYTASERSTIIGDMFKLVVPDKHLKDEGVRQYIAIRQDEAASNPSEFLADYSAIMVAGLASKEAKKVEYFKDLVKFGSPEEQDFARMMYVRVADMTEAVADYLDKTVGEGYDKYTEKAGDVYIELAESAKSVLHSLKEVEDIINDFRRIELMEPENWARMVKNAEVPTFDRDTLAKWRKGMLKGDSWLDSKRPTVFKEAMSLIGIGTKETSESTLGQDPGFLRSTFMPAAQLSEQYPLLKPAFNLAFSFRAQANNMMTRMLTPFLASTKGKEGHIDVEMNGLKKVLGDENANKAANVIALRKQDEQRILSDAEMRGMMGGLSADKQQAVIDFHRAAEATRPLIGEVWTKVMFDRIALGAAKMLMLKNKALTADDALALGTELRNTIYSSMGTKQVPGSEGIPKMQGRDAQAALQALGQKVGDNGAFMAARDLVFGRIQHIAKLLDTFQDDQGQWKSWYMSEVRSGQYFTRVYDQQGKFVAAHGFNDKSAMLSFAEQEQKKGMVVKTTDKYNEGDRFAGMDARLVSVYSDLERQEYARAKATLGENSPEFEQYQRFFDSLEAVFTPGAASEQVLKGRGFERHMIERKGVGGRESLNMVEGFFKHIESVSSGLSRSFAKEKASVLLDDPSLRQNQYLASLAKDHLTNVLYPSAREWVGFKNTIFNYFLGFNVSSMALEMSQSLLTVAPELVNKGAGIGQAYAMLANAAVDIANANMKNGGKFLDPNVEAAVQRAYKNQVLDFGLWHDFHNQEDLAISNLRSLTQGGVLHKAGEMLAKPFAWYTQAARALYSKGPKFNAKLTFVTAFKMEFERSHNAAKAYDFAEQMVRTTNYSGGAAARPVGMYARAGKFQGAVGAAMSLQTYTLSATSQMVRYLSDAINKQLPPDQAARAKKALVQMVATQFAFAGAMGMPMAAAGVSLLDEAFPQLEVKKNLRLWLSQLGGDDAEFGGQVADVAMKGIVGKLLPGDIDVGSRLGLGNFLGVNDFDGFSYKNLFGPGAAVAGNVVKGIQQASVGEFDKSAETLLPNAYKNFVRLANDGGEFRDEKGRLLFNGTEADKMLYSLGLKTSKLSSLREQQMLTKRSEDLAAQQLQKFHGELANLLEKGDNVGVKTRLLQKQQSDPMYDARAGARAVAQQVVERRYPVDPVRSGVRTNVDERQQIAATYAQRPQPGEVQRLLERKAAEKQLGIVGVGLPPTRAELTRAQMVDRLLKMYPHLSRQMAVAVVAQQLNPQPGQTRIPVY